MRFLIDNQLPPALARFIAAELGSEAKHVIDVGPQRRIGCGSVAVRIRQPIRRCVGKLCRKDEDFTHMARKGPDRWLIWVRVGNCRRAFLLELFRRLWTNVLERLESSERFIEIR